MVNQMPYDEMIQLRMNMLGGMNSYVLDKIGEETIMDYWRKYGVPDGADEDDLRDIAEDDTMWTEICRVFYHCVQVEYEENEED